MPDGRASAVLVVGAIVLCALAALVAYIFDSVLEGDGIAALDWPTVAWVAAHRQPVVTDFMRALSIVGSPVAATVVAIVICSLVFVTIFVTLNIKKNFIRGSLDLKM